MTACSKFVKRNFLLLDEPLLPYCHRFGCSEKIQEKIGWIINWMWLQCVKLEAIWVLNLSSRWGVFEKCNIKFFLLRWQDNGHALGPKEGTFFAGMAFVAGVLAGMLGIGGAIIITPLLLSVGIVPQVRFLTLSLQLLCWDSAFCRDWLSGFKNFGRGALNHSDIWKPFALSCFSSKKATHVAN